MKKILVSAAIAAALAAALAAGIFVTSVAANDDDDFGHFGFFPGTLVLSRSVYVGKASTVTVGQTLPPGCVAGTVEVPLLAGGTVSVKVACGTATSDGSYPTVFNNDKSGGSFGVTSPIFLDSITPDGFRLGIILKSSCRSSVGRWGSGYAVPCQSPRLTRRPPAD